MSLVLGARVVGVLLLVLGRVVQVVRRVESTLPLMLGRAARKVRRERLHGGHVSVRRRPLLLRRRVVVDGRFRVQFQETLRLEGRQRARRLDDLGVAIPPTGVAGICC